MSIIAGIGFLIKYTLVPGRERQIKYGNNVELSLFGLDRHEWGTIHLILSFIFLGLLTLHLILHWKAITCVFNRLVQGKKLKKAIAFSFMALTSLLIVVPVLIRPKITTIENKNGLHITEHYGNAKGVKSNEEVKTPISSNKLKVNERYQNRPD